MTNDLMPYGLGVIRPLVRLNGNRRRSQTERPRTLAPKPALLVGLVLAALVAQLAQAQPPTNSITACSTITKPGVYEIDAALTQSAPIDCILIKAANVTLNLNRQTLTGSGAGAGVHIAAAAGNAFIEGDSATITGFADGIEIDGSNAFVENFFSNHNSDAGVYLKGAKQARVTNFSANFNTDGVRISNGTLNAIQNSNCVANTRYGIWLLATTHNSVGSFDSQNNAIAGIYAGCSTAGPRSSLCKPAVPASNFNFIFDGVADSNGEYGVALDLADNNNRMANNISELNSTLDMFDANSDCANNLWFANAFGTSNVAPPPTGCIH